MDPILSALDKQYLTLHGRSIKLIHEIPEEILFQKAADDQDLVMKLTVGENVIRSAAFVEMTFGGITSRLWDDPFEWTLTEALSGTARIVEYLNEVEAARQNGFRFFRSDADLGRSIPAPRDLRSIGEVLIDTLARAEHYQGRAFAIYQTLTITKTATR